MKKSFASMALAASVLLSGNIQAHHTAQDVSDSPSMISRIAQFPKNHPYLTAAAVTTAGVSLVMTALSDNVTIDITRFQMEMDTAIARRTPGLENFRFDTTLSMLKNFSTLRNYVPKEVLDVTGSLLDRFLGCSNLAWYNVRGSTQCLDRRASTLRAGLSPFVVVDALKYTFNNRYNG